MEQQPDFSKDSEYVFVGDISLIEGNKVYNAQLGKFKKYISFGYQNEWYDNGKAEFDYGTINSANYDLVKLVPDMIDTFKNMAIHNLALLELSLK